MLRLKKKKKSGLLSELCCYLTSLIVYICISHLSLPHLAFFLYEADFHKKINWSPEKRMTINGSDWWREGDSLIKVHVVLINMPRNNRIIRQHHVQPSGFISSFPERKGECMSWSWSTASNCFRNLFRSQGMGIKNVIISWNVYEAVSNRTWLWLQGLFTVTYKKRCCKRLHISPSVIRSSWQSVSRRCVTWEGVILPKIGRHNTYLSFSQI